MIVLTALGNRAAGQAGFGTYIGVAAMTLGVFLAHPIWWAIPLYAATLWLWRAPSPEPWYHVPQGTGTWFDAFTRGLYVIPFAVLLGVVTHSLLHLALGVAAVFLVPAAYWVGFKWGRNQPIQVAELLAGLVVGCI